MCMGSVVYILLSTYSPYHYCTCLIVNVCYQLSLICWWAMMILMAIDQGWSSAAAGEGWFSFMCKTEQRWRLACAGKSLEVDNFQWLTSTCKLPCFSLYYTYRQVNLRQQQHLIDPDRWLSGAPLPINISVRVSNIRY